MFNLGQIFQEAAAIYATEQADSALLAAGQDVQIPVSPQIGTAGGRPIYLVSHLTTAKPGTHAAPLTASGANEVQ